MKSGNKRTYIIALLAGLALVLLRTVLLRQPQELMTYKVERDDLTETVKITGTYTAASQTPVFSPTQGVIAEVFVSDQEVVRKDAPLFRVESTATKEQKALAYAAYQQALASLQAAKQAKEALDVSMWTKQKSLFDAENNLNFMNDKLATNEDNPATKEPYTQLEIESIKSAVTKANKDFVVTETQYKQADQNIAAAAAAANAAKLTYESTTNQTVMAPIGGKVVNLQKTVGNGVAAGADSGPVLLITGQTAPIILARASEVDVARLSANQTAQIIFEADKKTAYQGSVQRTDSIGTTKAGITTYEVYIELIESPPVFIKPGMTATVNINTFTKTGVKSVPNTAIIYQDNQKFVKKAADGELIKIEAGYRGLIETEVVSDLPEGLEILLTTKN